MEPCGEEKHEPRRRRWKEVETRDRQNLESCSYGGAAEGRRRGGAAEREEKRMSGCVLCVRYEGLRV